MSVNKVILIGRLGKTPEIINTERTTICSMALATDEGYKDKSGNKVEKTEWHNLVCYDKLAEICEKYLDKGSQIYIEGKLKTRSWEDKSGNKRYTTEVIMNSMQMLDTKKKESQNNSDLPESDTKPGGEKQDYSDLPF